MAVGSVSAKRLGTTGHRARPTNCNARLRITNHQPLTTGPIGSVLQTLPSRRPTPPPHKPQRAPPN
jgi:hypothetical protein